VIDEVEIHPSACVDQPSHIGPGTRIWHFCHISKHAHIGDACVLGQNVFVGEGVSIGSRVRIQNNVSVYPGTVVEDDVFLGPSCVLTNVTNPRSEISRKAMLEQTVIKKGATVGANATIICGVTLGRYAFVAAGSVVTKDVPDYGFVVGVPARDRGFISRHGHPLVLVSGEAVCPESGLRYRLDQDGSLRCVEVSEDASLPQEMRAGQMSYRDVNKTR
jgi:UDP-2-acetamido-3-amino-2,3-dideoxy-glucuronate N-acetyltransferase